MEFMQWTESRYLRPVIMVDATPAANATCLRNGFDLVQLLRPFSVLQNSTLTAHVGEKGEAVAVRNFGVRLVRRECLGEVGTDSFRRHTQRTMRGAAAIDLAYGEQLDRAVAELVDPVMGGPLPSPARLSTPAMASTLLERSHPIWHQQFIRDYHSLVRCGDFETTDHPVGVIYAASTNEPGGIDGILRAFKAQAQRARQLRHDMPGMDPELHQYYILVHDVTGKPQTAAVNDTTASSSSPAAAAASRGPSVQDARRYLAAVQQLHGSNYCALIKVNSVPNPQDVKCLDPTPWVEANPVCLDVPSAAAEAAAAAAVTSSSANTPPPSTAAAAAAAATRGSTTSSANPTPGGSFAGPSGHQNSSSGNAGGPSPLGFNRVHSIVGKWPSGVVKVTGCYMSPGDVAEVKEVMGYYLSMSIFRFLERRLRVLDANVQDRRTTTLSKVANWFKSKEEQKPRAEVQYPTDGGGSPRYLASSLEMMMRHCGDLSMFLQDYTGAVEFYKMCLEELMSTISQRPFNRPVIAGCQEGIGIAYFLLGKLIMPSTTPWYTGGTRHGVKLQQTCRLEVAANDYLAGGMQTYALRMAFYLYEFCRTRSPPAMERAKASLQHVLRSGLTNNNQLFAAVVSDMLATTSLFVNPPYPAGQLTSAAGMVRGLVGTGAYTMPVDYPVEFKLRTYVRFLLEAGARYNEVRAAETALRCYLRVLEILRALGGRGCWGEMYEHVLMTVSRIYFTLGQNIKGLVVASAAVAHGVPLYSNRHSGLENFRLFWDRQAKVLASMGYSLSPHIPMPCIVRSSFQISYNPYFTDDATQDAGRKLGKQTVEQEWREVENLLKTHFQKNILRATAYKFPGYHGEMKHDLVFTHPARECTGVTVTPAGSSSSGSHKHYHIAHTEPLWLSFVIDNPVGGALTARDISILYLSRLKPDQLWKSAATRTVTLEAGAKEEVALAFSPLEVGEYVVIGLCWSLLGQEGYYYFATKESRPGCSESLYEYAIEHPAPSLDAEENITVTVTAPRAWVTAMLQPPLPSRLRDGEYFHTNLVVKNGSAQEAATNVTLQRSPRNAHLMYLEDVGIAKNLRKETALRLADTLKPGESRSFKLTVRAQHDRGDATVKCMNNLFFLIGYVPGDLDAPPATHDDHSNRKAGSRNFSGNAVRLHRLLRRVEVVPLMALYSTVLAPSNASLASAVVITAKHIPTTAVEAASNSPALTPAADPGSGGGGNNNNSRQSTTRKPPVRVSRVMAVHRPQWSVNCAYTSDLATDRAVDCVVPAGSSLTLPLLVRRLPKDRGGGYDDINGEDSLLSTSATVVESGGAGAGAGALAGRQPTDDEEVFEDLDSDIEEALKENVSTAVTPAYISEECLPLDIALPSAAKARALVENVGADLASSPLNRYFMRTSFLGAGSVGNLPEQQTDALAFYLDKAGQAAETRHEKRMAERQTERRVYGGLLEKYTPLVVAVAWVIDNGPDAPLSSGQLFHFVDPVSFLQQPVAMSAQTGETWEELSGATASVEHQQHLCECLTKNRTTVTTQQGAVIYHARVPSRVQTTPTLPTAALAPVLFRCLSLSSVPLLVEVAAAAPEAIAASHERSLPLLFVGKTKYGFLLFPSTVHEVEFVAHILVPGFVDCNCFQVTATPLLYQPGLDLRTGLSRSDFVRKVRHAFGGAGGAGAGGGQQHQQQQSTVLFTSPYSSVTSRWTGGVAGQQSMTSFLSRPPPDDENDSVCVPGVGPTGSASSFGASAHSRTARAARQLAGLQQSGSLLNASLHGNARGQVEDFIQQLVPRGFHRKRVRVLGRDVPALTEAHFLHLGTPESPDSAGGSRGEGPPSYRAASEAAFIAKNRSYAEDMAAFAARAKIFREKEAARSSNSSHGGRTTYVYRPRVRSLSSLSKGTPSPLASRAKPQRDNAASQPPSEAPMATATAAGSNLPGTATTSPMTRTATQPPSINDLFGPASPPATLAAAAGSAAAATSCASASSATPPLGPHRQPHGLVPLDLFMPETPDKARQAGEQDAERPTTDAETMPSPFSPIVSHRPSHPLGGDHEGNNSSRREDCPSTQTLASPLQLPAYGRTLSQQGIDTTSDWVYGDVASPVLLPHDASRVAFPVTEDEDDDNTANTTDTNNNVSSTAATIAPPSTASHALDTSSAFPAVDEDEDPLPPPPVKQQPVAANTSGRTRHLLITKKKHPFATSSSSSSTSSRSSSAPRSAAAIRTATVVGVAGGGRRGELTQLPEGRVVSRTTSLHTPPPGTQGTMPDSGSAHPAGGGKE